MLLSSRIADTPNYSLRNGTLIQLAQTHYNSNESGSLVKC